MVLHPLRMNTPWGYRGANASPPMALVQPQTIREPIREGR